MLNSIGSAVWNSKYAAYEGETFKDGCKRVVSITDRYLTDTEQAEMLHQLTSLRYLPGGRILFGAGKPKAYMQNCGLFGVDDSAEAWAKLLHDTSMSLMRGLGVGVDYSLIRPYGSYIAGSGGTASGAISLMEMVNETARHIRQGNTRRAACYASLHWKHGDIFRFIQSKNWTQEQKAAKEKDVYAVATLDIHNISVRFDYNFLLAYNDSNHLDHNHAVKVFDMLIRNMFETGEPGIQYDWDDNIYRNGCTEVISNQSGDSCTLASINLANISTLAEMEQAIKYAVITALIVRATSLYPTEEMRQVALNNMRLGVGFFGLHNWLLNRGYPYEWNSELAEWINQFKDMSRFYADKYAAKFGFARPIAVNAVAPTGSISRVAGGVSSGCEPIYSAAYLWRYQDGNERKEQITIDPYVFQLVQSGKVNPYEPFTDALSLATPEGFKHRVEMQANIQQYTDNAISSTINLPQWNTPGNDASTLEYYKSVILEYMPLLRGCTIYPNGARSGQPLTPVSLVDALQSNGYTIDSEYSNCNSGLCST
jgi:ribonucleoside-diphosphate reductase alpha chain